MAKNRVHEFYRTLRDNESLTFPMKYQYMAQEAARVEENNIALREMVLRLANEAKGWLDDARGCQPADLIGYDGWYENAQALANGDDARFVMAREFGTSDPAKAG